MTLLIFSHPHAVQSLGATSLLAHDRALPKPTLISVVPGAPQVSRPVSIRQAEDALAHCAGSPRGCEQRTPLIPYLGFHNSALSHDTIIAPHSLNPAKTKLNSVLLLLNPPSLSRESKVFQGVARGELSGRNPSSSLRRRNPLGKEDLNSTCPTGKEREDLAVPLCLHPKLCAGRDKP